MKILLISLVSLFMSLFVPLSNEQLDQKEEFMQVCNNGYNTYFVLTEEETYQYYLQVVCGEYNNEISYSILFVPSTPNEYSIKLKVSGANKYITLPSDGRGDVMIYDLVISKDAKIEVGTQNKTTFSFVINKINTSEYQLNANIIKGNNQGLPTTDIKAFTGIELTYTLSIIFFVIIIISIIIILVLYSKKQGMFDKDTIDKEFEEQHQFRDNIQNIIKEQEKTIEVEAEEVKEESVKEVYQKIQDDDDEERDISLLLKEKGFNTNYNTLLTHEKNEIMLELMKMKDFKEITEEEYKKEIIKLWM